MSSLLLGTFSLVLLWIGGWFGRGKSSESFKARRSSPASSAPEGTGTITLTLPSLSVVVSVPTWDKGLMNWVSLSELERFDVFSSVSGKMIGLDLRSTLGLLLLLSFFWTIGELCRTTRGEGGNFFAGGG